MLQKLTIKTFLKNSHTLYRLLQANRHGMWEYTVANELHFCIFVCFYLAVMECKRFINKSDTEITYEEAFLVYNSHGEIGGLCRLLNIDTQSKNAEVWGLTFRGNTETHEALRALEDYCANTLKLKSFYGEVKVTNIACQRFWEKHGYDKKTPDSDIPDKVKYITYTKNLVPQTTR